MKNRIFLSVLGLALLIGSCIKEDESVHVDTVTLDKTSLSMVIGDKVDLTATVAPADADNKSLVWTSTREDVAMVSSSGSVVAMAKGYAVIMAKSRDSGVSAICEVDVYEKSVPLESISIEPKTLTMHFTATDTLHYSLIPANTTQYDLTWTSSDDSVAIVSDGTVIARHVGEATIYARGADDTVVDSCLVTVVAHLNPLQSLSLDRNKLDMYVMESDTLECIFYPENTTERRIKWTSSDPQVAIVNQGAVTALREGQTMIYASGADGTKTDSCLVTVSQLLFPLQSIRLSDHLLNMYLMESDTLSYILEPENTTDDRVRWISSDNDIAIVNGGVVTALRVGKATVTVMGANGQAADSCLVNVSAKVYPLKEIKLDKHSMSLFLKESDTISYILNPANTTEYKLQWASSNSEVAIVNNGIVTALSEGRAMVYAIGASGSIKDSCSVTVAPHTYPLEKLSLSAHKLTMTEMESDTIVCTLTPQNTTDDKILWTSSDNTVAVVNNGIVTALRAGTATISASGASGSIADACTITVICKVSGVKLSKHEDVSETGKTLSMAATVYPSRATDKEVSWKSSDIGVASVDSEGKVRTKKAGATTITVTTKDGEFSDSCLLTVISPVSGLSLDSTKVTMFEGDDIDIKALVEPLDATNPEISWVSSNLDVATVDAGHVVALQAGQTTIVAVTKDGGFVKTCNVFVYKHVSSIILDSDTALYQGESIELDPVVLPEEAPNKELLWSSSNTDIVSVQNGIITAVGRGVAVVTATSADKADIKASISVRVKKHVESLYLACPNPIYENDSIVLKTTVVPADADDRALVYKSDNTAVATVDADGTVHGVKAGKTRITVTSHDLGKTAECEVTVLCHVEGISVEQTQIVGFVGEQITLKAAVLPDRATDKGVKWTSSDSKVASVIHEDDNSYTLWLRNTGEAIITVVSNDNKNAMATVNVKVSSHSEKVSLNTNSAGIFENDSLQLTAVVTPYNDPELVKWSTSDPNIATVSDKGLVSAKSKGTVTIKATATDNDQHFDICTVEVKRHVSSVVFLKKTSSIYHNGSFAFQVFVSPSDASDRTVSWSSSDSRIISVDQTGNATAVGYGSAVITATTNDKGLTVSQEVTVTPCIERVEISGPANHFSGNIFNWYASDGVLPLSTIVYPTDYPEDKSVTWSSDDAQVVEYVGGNLVPKSAGTAKLTVRTVGNKSNGKPATSEVTVRILEHVERVSLSETELTLHPQDTHTLIPEVFPESADNSVTWESTNTSVATVSADGTVTAVSKGETQIIVTTVDRSKTAVCTVTVTDPINRISSISLSPASQTLKVNAVSYLSAKISPANASEKTLRWTVNHSDVVMFELENGELVSSTDAENVFVRAVGPGIATVTCTALDGSACSASCEITVPAPKLVESVVLSQNAITLVEGKQTGITATVSPFDAENKEVRWTTTDSSIADISVSGTAVTVTGVSSGTATITCEALDGSGTKASCTVTVIEEVLVQSIFVESKQTGEAVSRIDMYVGQKYDLLSNVNIIIYPDNATNKTLRYRPAQGGRITYKDGVITAESAGRSQLSIEATDGTESSFIINVVVSTVAVTGVSLPAKVTVKPGNSITLTPTISPENATDKTVTWSSDNTAVAIVDNNGKVTGLKAGTAEITATTKDGGKKATCTVIVTNASTGEDVGFDDWN